jgi:hypothetical protein
MRGLKSIGWSILILLVLFALGMMLSGCDLSFINESTNNNNINPSGPSGVSPSPSTSPSPGVVVATLNVAEYGREGGPACGEGSTLGYRPGEPYCRVLITCTPRDADGVDIGAKLPPPVWFNAQATTVNPWNARGECSSGTGTVTFACSVGGKTDDRTYTCVPVAP